MIQYGWYIPLSLREEYSYVQLLVMCHLVVGLRCHVDEKKCLPRIDRPRRDVCLWPRDIAADALHVISRFKGALAGYVAWLHDLQSGRKFSCKDNGWQMV